MDATAEELRCEWSVHSCSSETEVHKAANALKSELYRVWQTAQPADEAWIVLEACPPSAFSRMEIVNAGSALVEVFGLPDDNPYEDDPQFIMLLSAQQLMSTKDVIGKANRNRSFTYNCSDKLSRLAAQHRWKQIKVICRQPFGSEEQKTCIGLSRLNFKLCKTSAEVAADAAEAHLQQNLKVGLAKMFPKGASSAEGEVISQVTEPSKLKVEQEVARGGSHSPPRGKRKLPAWQSPSKHMKKEAKKVDAGHGALSSEDGEEISESVEVPHNQKSTPKVSRPERGGKRTPSVSIKQQDKEGNAQSPKNSESHKSKSSPHQLSKGPSTQSRKGSERGSREGSPKPAGPKQHSQGRLLQSRDNSELSTTEGSSIPGPHQALKPTATLRVFDQPESSRKEPSGQVGSSTQVQRARGKKEATQSKLSLGEGNKGPSQSSSRVHEPRQSNAITHSFSKFLNGVVFAISGLVNPERAEVRDKALEMGGQYRPDWSSDCTLLICAFANTPKFNQVKNDNGTIVSKVWIQECYKQKKLVEIEKYLMHAGKPWRQIEASAADELDEESGLGHDDSIALGSLQDLKQWVCEDVATSITWLKQQETQPEASQLKFVAIQGIQACLDDTIECLKSKQSIKKIMDSWDYVPRAVRELAGREEKSGNAKKNFWSDMLSEAERLKWIYSKELEKMMKLTGESVAEKYGKQKSMVDEDDASTDVMSDDLSSDNTQVLDEEDIREAEEAISKLLSGQT